MFLEAVIMEYSSMWRENQSLQRFLDVWANLNPILCRERGLKYSVPTCFLKINSWIEKRDPCSNTFAIALTWDSGIHGVLAPWLPMKLSCDLVLWLLFGANQLLIRQGDPERTGLCSSSTHADIESAISSKHFDPGIWSCLAPVPNRGEHQLPTWCGEQPWASY